MPSFIRRRRHRPRGRRMARSAGPRALRMVRSLKPFVDKELHISDHKSLGTAVGVDNVTSFFQLCEIAEGVNDSDRTGVQCTLRSIAYKLFFLAGNTDACVRVTMFRDTQANGTLPTSLQLYEDATSGGGALIVSAMNNDNIKRFRILQDYHVLLSTNWRPVACVKRFKRLGTRMRFSGPSALSTDIISGGLWFAMTSNTAGGGANPTVELASRIRFAP